MQLPDIAATSGFLQSSILLKKSCPPERYIYISRGYKLHIELGGVGEARNGRYTRYGKI